MHAQQIGVPDANKAHEIEQAALMTVVYPDPRAEDLSQQRAWETDRNRTADPQAVPHVAAPGVALGGL